MSVIRTATSEDLRAAADRFALRVADLVRERDAALAEASMNVRIIAAWEAKVRDYGIEIRRLTEQAEALAAERDLAAAAGEDIARALCDAERENAGLRADRRWWRRR